ncbi:cytochrome c [Limobrevibacterium gyesilva]|uniref:Cytochrome c n=1 Tax=Limobrevibacterium gyesilva TaxID=2991712 RepID=A0AA41YPI6_9PROT|nr:cytochrome c [Limobrevibacterium gyesilva]MCW3477324.1 cytochrome c [Limobrevibacterium gyesilva]
MIGRLVLILLLLCRVLPAGAAEPVLTLSVGDSEQRFSVAGLLARPDAADLAVPRDASYGRAMSYRAVPLRALLAMLPQGAIDTLEARATDGFVSQLPFAIVAGGAAIPWIAVEDPAHPWPNLPGKAVSAGPFYLVWEHPERAGISAEQWPYALSGLAGVAPPAQRWPALAVAAALPPDAPARRGQAVFAVQCLPCHRLHGAGAGEMGPDLGSPMPAVRYMTIPGLRALIRDPKSVRAWPQQQMPAFDAAALPDADLDALIAYLQHLAAR